MSDMHALITIKMVAMTLFHKKAQIGPGCNTITIAINITVLLLLLVILMLLLNKDECKSLGNAALIVNVQIGVGSRCGGCFK